MEINTLWSAVLTGLVGLVGFVLRNYISEVSRLQILINRTREEVAKEYVTKQEVHTDINRVLDRIERLDHKLDRLIENNQWDGADRRAR